jgi:hypothetical protein
MPNALKTTTSHNDLLVGLPAGVAVANLQSTSAEKLVEAGADGLHVGYQGLLAARKGYLNTVAVIVVLYNRQRDTSVRRIILNYLDDDIADDYRHYTKRKIKPDHILLALDKAAHERAKERGEDYAGIFGSTRSRIVQNARYVLDQGDTLAEQIENLNESPTMAALSDKRSKANKKGEPKSAQAEAAEKKRQARIDAAMQRPARGRVEVSSQDAEFVQAGVKLALVRIVAEHVVELVDVCATQDNLATELAALASKWEVVA